MNFASQPNVPSGDPAKPICPRPWLGLLVGGFWVCLVLSGIHPKDQFVWFLEVLPALLGFALVFVRARMKAD